MSKRVGVLTVTLALSLSITTGFVSNTHALGTPPSVILFPPFFFKTCVSVNGAEGSTTAGASITRTSWSWGDGMVTSGGFPQHHTYAANGNYMLTVTATDSNGLSGSASTSLSIAGSTTLEAPRLSIFPASISELTVSINGVGDSDTCGPLPIPPFSFSWGDGTTSTGFFVQSHTYVSSGTFNVCVTATDSFGLTTTKCELVTVSAPLTVSKFFTDSSLNPLSLDSNGNPMVSVTLANGQVARSNPGQVLAWVNVTSTSGSSLQSLKLNHTLPVDWAVNPAWMPAKGAIHVYYANTTSLATSPEITQPSTITVSTGNPETVHLAIANLTATAIGHPLMPGQSILLSVKLSYGLVKTAQSPASYPRNYTDTASAVAWTQPSYTGNEATGTGSAFFIAYAKVVGDSAGLDDSHIIAVGKYATR